MGFGDFKIRLIKMGYGYGGPRLASWPLLGACFMCPGELFLTWLGAKGKRFIRLI